MQGLVKRFFNEKEVTSTLVMDALYTGCKALEEAGRRHIKVGCRLFARFGVSWAPTMVDAHDAPTKNATGHATLQSMATN